MTTSVLVPSSLAREAEDRREATRKLGYVARAATVFRVDRLTVYPDPDGTETWEAGFVETVLRYAATPPYLRKAVWERRGELEYAGVMPPLRVRSRTGSGSDESGSSRQGIVTEVGSDGRVRVNCGLQHPVSLPVPADLAVPDEGERVTVRVSSRRPVRAKLEGGPPPGFVVGAADLDTALARTDAGLTVAASRHGAEVTVTTLDQLVERIRDDDGTPADEDDTATTGGRQPTGDLTVAFGAPERGLPAIRDVDPEWVGDAVLRGIGDAGGAMDSEEPSDDRRFDLWLNTVPNQGSEVVRTEEAMFATLALLSLKR